MLKVKKMKTIQQHLKKHGTSLLPIVKMSPLESTPYMLRLTPYDKYNSDDVVQFLEQYIGTDIYMFTEEYSKRNKFHFHVCFYSCRDEDEIRACVRKFLLLKFDGVNARGDANKRYNLTEVLDFEQSVIYIIKDGGEIVYGSQINQDAVDQRKKFSYKKFSKDDFASELEEFKVRIKDEDLSLFEIMDGLFKLKATYRQSVNLRRLYEMALSFHVHNDLSRSSRFVDDFLSRL